MPSKKFEIYDYGINKICYPKTTCDNVKGYKNYNAKQFLECFEKASYSGEIRNKNHYICDIEGRYYIYLDKVFLDTIEGAYKVFVYLNGILLLEDKDYVYVAPTVIRLTSPASLNDIFTFEFITSTKYLLNKPKDTTAPIEEKILINDMIYSLNIYGRGEFSG